MSALAFVLQCAAIAALASGAASLLLLALTLPARPLLQRLTAARRADALLLAAVLPALACLAVVLGAATPPLLAALGLGADHCPTHTHHAHLCLLHPGRLHSAVAALGAVSLAVLTFRAAWLLSSLRDTRRRLDVLEQLGSARPGSRFPVIAVRGARGLCHSAGVFSRRIFVSSELLETLSTDEARAALAHEEAHLTRRDPLSCLALSVAKLFWLPGLAALLQRDFHAAMEEACDADAARSLGDAALVASALVNVATLQSEQARDAVPAFGEGALEARVHKLLGERPPKVAASLAAALLLAAGAAAAVTTAVGADALHHAAETALHLLF